MKGLGKRHHEGFVGGGKGHLMWRGTRKEKEGIQEIRCQLSPEKIEFHPWW